MHKLQSILLATDFQSPNHDATRAVAQLAAVFDAEITVLHVFLSEQTYPSLAQLERQDAALHMEALAQELNRQRLRLAATPIVNGHPAEAIVRKAGEIDADLIVIGAGNRMVFGRFSPGPVAEAVVQRAVAPVLAVRPGEPALGFKKIVCPIDFSPASERGLRNAIGLARGMGGQVIVVTVIPEHAWLATAVETGKLIGAHQEYKRSWRDEFHRFLLTIEFGEVPWTSEIVSGVPQEEIIRTALKHNADLLVMGSHGRSGLARVLLGSVTRRVLQQLPCSLLTVKNEDAFGQMFEEDLRYIRLLMAEGQEYLKNGVADRAAGKFRNVLAANPFYLPALEGLAEAYDRMGEADKAERCRQRGALLLHEHEAVGSP
jgi:nucleotide-binding universal stress UspA family protein